jgi:RHS repeat-associated protein
MIAARETASNANTTPVVPYTNGTYIDEVLGIYHPNGQNTDKYCYHANGLYSVAALTDSTQAVVERYKYEAFGQRLEQDGLTPMTASAVGNSIGFTGRVHDVTGLMYYRARMTNPAFGRFCARDQMGYLGSPWNLYEYTKNRPTFLVDPLGYWMGPTHSGMTLGACAVVGLCPGCCEIIAQANEETDGSPADAVAWKQGKNTSDPERHNMVAGDISGLPPAGQLAARLAAAAATEAYVVKQIHAGVQAFREGKCRLALEELGHGLHAAQDSWAHRNAAGHPISDAEHRADMSYDDRNAPRNRLPDNPMDTDKAVSDPNNASRLLVATGVTMHYIQGVKRTAGCCCSQPRVRGQTVPCETLCDPQRYPPDPSCCPRSNGESGAR